MQAYQRHIKVSDLLRAPGKTDDIDFSDRMIPDLPNVLAPGVSWSIRLTSLNNRCVEVILENISCKVEYISDISGEPFEKEILLDFYEALFCFPENQWDKETNLDVYTSYADIYDIEEKDTSIDILSCITNAIKSQEPLVKMKDDEKMSEWWEIDENYL